MNAIPTNQPLPSTRCSTQLTRFSPLGRPVQHKKILHITCDSACRGRSSPVGNHQRWNEPWHKDGTHEWVLIPFSTTLPVVGECNIPMSLVSCERQESVVGEARGGTAPSAICATLWAITPISVMAGAGMQTGEGCQRSIKA